jgi:hypothetical protein
MNPFKVLEVARDASKGEIVRAASLALRRRAFSALQIATAEKMLLDPVRRTEAEFLYFAAFERLLAEYRDPPSDPFQSDAQALQRLAIFD